MDLHELYLWCLVMLPLMTSPGPANIATASVSASRGFRAAILFACGITLINVLAVTLMGFGMGLVYVKYHQVFQVLERLGALYIIYLGVVILRSSPAASADSSDEKGKALGFRDALVLQVLNTKLYPTLTMMFSQFIDGDASTSVEVLTLSALFVGVAAVNYVCWAWIGVALGRAKGSWAGWIQRYGFGGLLVLVGLWLLIH